MRLLHYLEIKNFKSFGDLVRIELDHPSVVIGPNNCGKTTALQAIAVWSQAVQTWAARKGGITASLRKRPATALNRLGIVAVPVGSVRYFWHNLNVRVARSNIPISITAGIQDDDDDGLVKPVTMTFRYQGSELVYCAPDTETLKVPRLISSAAGIRVALLYPMSGLEAEEPVLKPGRIEVLMGLGQTAQVLRNLCLIVTQSSPSKWEEIVDLMTRLFGVELGIPKETTRGTIDLSYKQQGVRRQLDISASGRGLQQMLLVLAYLYSRPRTVLLIDEPDAHLELLRQKQVFLLLRDIATRNKSQVVLVTHSEVILDEAIDRDPVLLLDGQPESLGKRGIRSALKYYGAEHYIKARQRGYVLYVEGGTDLDALRALAERIQHPVADVWDTSVNAYYVRNNHPSPELEAELERVEMGFGGSPQDHFSAVRTLLPDFRGLAVLDSDGQRRTDLVVGGLQVVYWRRYEVENYFVTPEVLRRHVTDSCSQWPLLTASESTLDEVLDGLTLERVFQGRRTEFTEWKQLDGNLGRLFWEAKTENVKLSSFAEEFFRRLAEKLGMPMLLRKSDLFRLVQWVDPATIDPDVHAKLDLLADLFQNARSV